MPTMTARIDDWLRDEIVAFWEAHGSGPSAALRHVAEEWWTMQRLPSITFRDGVSGRRAVIRSGPDVWEVVRVARDYGADRDGLAAHFSPWVSPEAVYEALRYAEYFPDEIAALLAEDRRIEALLAER